MCDVENVVISFHHPFMLTLCGPSQSGKTFWIHKLIKYVDEMITPKITKIVFLYSTYQDKYDEMQKVVKEKKMAPITFIDCNKGIPSIFDIQPDIKENTLVILDDLMTITASNKENITKLNNLSCRDSHHSNISVIFVCQNLMYGDGKLRTSRVNSQYMVVFKNLADYRNMHLIADNKKLNRQLFLNILNEINETPYGYLVFDSCVKSCDNTRIRTNIFPDEKTIIYDI